MTSFKEKSLSYDVEGNGRSKITTIVICVIIASLIVIGISLAASSNNREQVTSSSHYSQPSEEISRLETNEDSVDEDDEKETSVDQTPEDDKIYAPEGLSYYRVLSVTDGDTIRINYNGESTPVRMIGIDTPETKHPRKPVECFGPQASDYASSMLAGKSVQLEFDPSQDTVDYYGRLLAYVYVDNISYNQQAILNGYAYEYTYNDAYKYQKQFRMAESEARSNSRGLWSAATCNGSR